MPNVIQMDDSLVEAMQAGDESALGAIIDRYTAYVGSRTVTSVPNTEAGVGPVRGILSGRKCCGMWCWSVSGP